MSENIAFMSLPKDRFRAVSNKLLNECFLLKKSKDTSSDYLYILNNREAFSSFFDLLGYELIISEEYGVISLNNPMGTGRIHLKKIESILLLIIRLLYIEKRKQLSQIEDVIIVSDEIYDKYAMLKMNNRLDKTTMRNALGLFKRYHLISNLDSDMSSPDSVLKEYIDYRSYLDYDIEIISKDGKSQFFSKIYGEKSGGETQTPYYVAIAASFSQIYSYGESIRIIMLDEAFDKMDDDRIASMMGFFKSQKFQVILATPPAKMEIVGEYVDTILMTYRQGYASTVEEYTYEEI